MRMRCGAMATRGRISNVPISRIVRNTFANIYAKFGAFITNGNDSTYSQCLAAPLLGEILSFNLVYRMLGIDSGITEKSGSKNCYVF